LLKAVERILAEGAERVIESDGFKLELVPYSEVLRGAPVDDERAFYRACSDVFGPNTHAAGALTGDSGCLIVMRSLREDDTSKPMLEAMRKAASQFSGLRPAFIAIQEHGIEAADLMLPNVRRRAGILSYALFGHYGASHVNATYFTGFGAVVHQGEQIGTPAFAIPNPQPKFPTSAFDAAPFLESLSDRDYADAIGAPLPSSNISYLAIEEE
jgi:hypothetical protein